MTHNRILFAFSLSLSATVPVHAQISPKGATQATVEANRKYYSELNFDDKQDYEDVNKGLIVPLPGLSYKNSEGHVMWDLNEYGFLSKKEAPETINPSLYRMAQLNMPAGLFKVTDHIYQLRGLDLANMTIVEGKTGIIVIDPLGSGDASKTALDLYYNKFGKKEIIAVIITHSHGDHYGGIRGVVSEPDVRSGKVKLIAPEGFLQEAISENVYAGNAMLRRGTVCYCPVLKKGRLTEAWEKVPLRVKWASWNPMLRLKKRGNG